MVGGIQIKMKCSGSFSLPGNIFLFGLKIKQEIVLHNPIRSPSKKDFHNRVDGYISHKCGPLISLLILFQFWLCALFHFWLTLSLSHWFWPFSLLCCSQLCKDPSTWGLWVICHSIISTHISYIDRFTDHGSVCFCSQGRICVLQLLHNASSFFFILFCSRFCLCIKLIDLWNL